MGQSWRFLLPLKISLFQTANKKTELIQKSYVLCPQSSSFLVPRPQSAKRSEKGYGDENVSSQPPNKVLLATDKSAVIIPNRTFLVRFGGISGEFGRAMVRILARRSQAKILMARQNEPDMPPKRTKKVRLGIYRTKFSQKSGKFLFLVFLLILDKIALFKPCLPGTKCNLCDTFLVFNTCFDSSVWRFILLIFKIKI